MPGRVKVAIVVLTGACFAAMVVAQPDAVLHGSMAAPVLHVD